MFCTLLATHECLHTYGCCRHEQDSSRRSCLPGMQAWLRVLSSAPYPTADAENAVSDAADSLKSGANDAKKGVKRNL